MTKNRERMISDILHKKAVLDMTKKRTNVPDRQFASLMKEQFIRLKKELKIMIKNYKLKYKKRGTGGK